MTGAAILPLLLAVPMAGALLLGFVRWPDRVARWFAAGVATLTLAVAAVVAAGFDRAEAGRPQDVVDARWLPAIDVRFHLGVDGVSLPLVLLTSLLVLLCTVHALRSELERARVLLSLVLLLEVGMLGTFVALDLVLFFVFFEVVLLPMYFVIALWGGTARRPAATKFVLFTLLGSALMLVGFVVIYAATGTFDMTALARVHGRGISAGTQLLAGILLLVGFGVKSPMWPLHTWLPDAHTEAPTIGSVLLAGVLLKMGTYGFLRILVPDLPHAAHDLAPALGCLGVVGIGYASFVCLDLARRGDADLKRLIAYSSVGHMGFVLLGISTLSRAGIQGALIGNIAHGVVTGLLFFLVGGVKDRYSSSRLDELGGGLLAKAPAVGGLLLFASIASLGLPGLAGFWGEMLALLGAYSPGSSLSRPLFAILLGLGAAGTVLTAVYFLAMLRRVDFGVVSERWRGATLPAARPTELAAWAPLAVLTVALGIWPAAVLSYSEPAVKGLLG